MQKTLDNNGNSNIILPTDRPTDRDALANERFEKSWFAVQSLAKKFLSNLKHYTSKDYQEAEVRKDFIDKLFVALGWDVNHESQHDPYRQEVKIEKPEKKAKGRADYSFSIAPHFKRVRFFVEAKRPQQDIATADNCFQAIRYSWPRNLPIAILTDFQYIYVLDSRYRPNINSSVSRIVDKWHCNDFNNRESFERLYWLLSREAVIKGAIENYADNVLPPPQSAVKQYSLFAHDVREFDDDFLQQLDDWRVSLASAFKKANNALTDNQLTEAVQRALDRLVFIRFLEDKLIEPDKIIERFGQNNKSHWQDFISVSKRLDETYNGIVFKPHSVVDDKNFQPNGTDFTQICDELTDEHSPYNFDSIPVEILGRIYERFLGKVVQSKRKTVEVIEKDDVRKAGGVFYTPDYIVAYMVEQSLGDKIKGKTPDEILKLHVIDTACGSGSFLIGAFGFLLETISTYYKKYPNKAKKGTLEERGDDGEKHLTLNYKRGVLINCIFGVDIDSQAVEVAQLSLYLKLMEDETTNSAHQSQMEIGAALLPSLMNNVVVGNSLVSLDDGDGDLFVLEKLRATKSLNFKATFPKVFQSGGFDLVIGNPPYIKEYTNREAFERVHNSPYYEGKMDLWYLFACLGLDWLKPESGVLAFIATNNWVTNAGAKKLRAKITVDAQIKQLIDFGDFKVFRDAGIQTMILIAQRSQKLASYQFDFRRLIGIKPQLSDAQALLEKVTGRDREYLTPTLDRSRVPTAPLTFSNSNIEAVLNQIASKKNFELDGKEIGNGIHPHHDFVNKKIADASNGIFTNGEGIFGLTQNEKNNLNLTKDELRLIKPYFTSEELERYYANPQNKLWIIYTGSEFKNPETILPYPNLKTHLDKFKQVITSDNKPYGLHRAREERFFIKDSIVAQRKCPNHPSFTYVDFPCYVPAMFNIIQTNRVDLKFLTGLLNSKLVKFWLRHRGKMQGQNFQVDKEPLMAIPLCVPSKIEQDKIAKLVKQIIECKQKRPSAQTDDDRVWFDRTIRQFENQIDALVVKLYELDENAQMLLDN